MLLPTRMAVLNHLNQVGIANLEEVMDSLKSEYGTEKQFNKELYLDHLMALEANGYLHLKKYELGKDDNLVLSFEITEDGRQAVDKYVPQEYR